MIAKLKPSRKIHLVLNVKNTLGLECKRDRLEGTLGYSNLFIYLLQLGPSVTQAEK